MPGDSLGRAEVEIRANTANLDADLKKGEAQVKAAVAGAGAEAAATTEKFSKTIKRSIGEVVGTGAAVVSVAAAIKRVDDAYREFLDSANQLTIAQRAIADSFGSGTTSAGLSQYEEAMIRINDAYQKQIASLESLETKRDIFTRFAESVMGGREVDALRETIETEERQARGREDARRKNREDLEREKQARKEAEEDEKRFEQRQKKISDELEKINEEAATSGLTEAEKIERERVKRIDAIGQYESEMGEQITQEAIDNINRIYDAKQRKLQEDDAKKREQERKEAEREQQRIADFEKSITTAYANAREQAMKVFDASNMNVHFTRIRELLSLIAGQRGE